MLRYSHYILFAGNLNTVTKTRVCNE